VTGIGRTGVVGVIKGKTNTVSGRTIGLRADMDALPIHEDGQGLCLQDPRRDACLRA
jgi:metal-dependent amidase/aminoacylase/carboxypeptidase family protein